MKNSHSNAKIPQALKDNIIVIPQHKFQHLIDQLPEKYDAITQILTDGRTSSELTDSQALNYAFALGVKIRGA